MLTESYCPADTSAAILDSTIAGILRDAAARGPDRIALVAGTADPAARARWTYAEVLAQAESVARSLADRFTPGERLAVLAPSTPESFVLSFAAAMARLVLVPMNPLLRAPEIAHVLGRSGAAGAFFVAEHRGQDLAGLLADVSPQLPALRELVPFADWAALLDRRHGATRQVAPAATARRRRAARVHVGHDGRAQGGDAHPPRDVQRVTPRRPPLRSGRR